MHKLFFLSSLFRRLFRLFRLFRMFLAGGFDTFEIRVGLEAGALQAPLDLRHTAQDGGAGVGGRGVGVAIGLENFGAQQLPLGDSRLVYEVLLGWVLGLILLADARGPRFSRNSAQLGVMQ
jgi:hypothetical protein